MLYRTAFLLSALVLAGCDALTNDEGETTWTRVGPYGAEVVEAATDDEERLYLATTRGLYRRAPNQATWTRMHGPEVVPPLFVTRAGAVITGRARGGLRILSPGSDDWYSAGDAFRIDVQQAQACGKFALGPFSLTPNLLAEGVDGTVYAGTDCGLFTSRSQAHRSWTRTDFVNETIKGVAALEDGARFVLIEEGLYRRVASGWTLVDVDGGTASGGFQKLVTDGRDVLYAFATRGFWGSRDAGRTWQRLPDPPGTPVRFLAHSGVLWTRTTAGKLYRSDDAGATWQKPDAPEELVAFAASPAGPLVVAQPTRLYRENAPGAFVEIDFTGIYEQRTTRVMEVGGAWVAQADDGLFRSNNRGETWTRLGPDRSLFALRFASGGSLYASQGSGGLYRSDDHGDSWMPLATVPGFVAEDGWVALADGRLVAQVDSGLVVSVDRGNSWTHLDAPAGIERVAAWDDVLSVLDTRGRVWQQRGTGAWALQAEGKRLLWPTLEYEVRDRTALFVAGPDGALYAVSDGLGQLNRLTPDGWVRVDIPGESLVRLFVRRDGRLVGDFAGNRSGVFQARPGGTRWERIDDDRLREAAAYSFGETTDGILLAATSQGILAGR